MGRKTPCLQLDNKEQEIKFLIQCSYLEGKSVQYQRDSLIFFFLTVECIKLLLITLKLLLFICYWRSVGTLCFVVPSTLDFHGKRANAFIFPIFKAFLDIEAGRNCLFFSYEYLIWHGMLWLASLCIRSIPPKRYKHVIY